MSGNELALLADARSALERARGLSEVKDILDVAVAAKKYAQAKRLGEESQRFAQEIVNLAMRRMGEMLAEMPKDRGGRPPKTPDTWSGVSTAPTLEELGVTEKQSSRAQALAKIPEPVFQANAAEPTNRLLQLAARQRQPDSVPEPIAPPPGKYRCIVIDPPWPMKKIERDERPNQGLTLDYPVMSLEEIADETHVPVRTLADENCHIYLWVTHKFLPVGLDLLTTWGFNYQCVMTWRKNVGITPFSWMYDTEHVLFGRRGDLPLTQLGLRLSFDASTVGHSVKPDVFYERVLAASPGPRVEMFARRERAGFVAWGNEVGR